MFYVFLFFSLIASSGHASTFRKKLFRQSTFDISLGTKNYSDLKISPDIVERSVSPVYEAQIGARFFRVYSFYLTGQMSISKDTHYAYSQAAGVGAGFRADLPGFFFLGAKKNELIRKSKTYPVSTYSYVGASVLSFQFNNEKTRDVLTEWGIAMDLFVFSEDLHLTLSGGISNLGGNSYIVNRVGLGWEY